ncbi:hypothetical protein NB636_02380 [Oxalobacter aliiformigenes]|uniref:glycine zipper domain-containing protein n=1 Tax=Oxalobacter aliiformigenes TaxID=2946593 RepID=UPI0022AEB8DA|nr:glycine zipper domain-containing protein [Oxalobacter aliiformigenes]MCZ4064379.1 hypothetical protein [Oxalobacter aliiformigenes]WAV99730.1 hypothetical protein NB636_02380 [Oxalobacter aliiformigenes]
MMKKMQFVLVMFFSFVMTACTTNIHPDTYSATAIGDVTRSIAGIVISARPVNVEGTSQVGGLAGVLAGGVAGSAIGGNSRVNALGAIAGAIVGALAGSAIEKDVTNQSGIEYVIKTDNDETLTLVQGPSPAFVVGQRVMVLYGKRARIIAYNEPVQPAGDAPAENMVNIQTQPAKPVLATGN